MANELGTPDPSLMNYLQILRRRRRWVVGLVGLCFVAAIGYSLTATKEYSASAQLLVQPSGGSVSINNNPVSVSPTDVLTALQLATSGPVKAAVTKQLGSAPQVSATQVGQTNVIQITATNPSPSEAAKIANAYATSFVAYQRSAALNNLTAAEAKLQSQITSIDSQIARLQGQRSSASTANQITALANEESVLKGQLAQLEVSGAVSPGGLEVVTAATVPTSPSSPKPLEDSLIGLVLGLVLGLGVAFLVEYLDDRVYSTEDVERIFPDAPMMALVPVVVSWRNTKVPVIATLSEPGSPVAEAYRSLRTSLQFAAHDRPLRTILVTSASATEGKTSTVSNLAVVLAGAGQRVVVVSADLRRPRVGQFFDMSEEVGLTSVILGQSTLADAVLPVQSVERVSLLGTGPLPPNPAELLQSSRTSEILEALMSSFHVVLIDSPPVLPVTDAVVLAGRADATLLVVAAGRTKRGDLARAAETLSRVDTPRVGIVLNAVTRESGYGYGRSYGYTYHDGYSSGYTPASSNGAGTNGNGASRGLSRKELRAARGGRA